MWPLGNLLNATTQIASQQLVHFCQNLTRNNFLTQGKAYLAGLRFPSPILPDSTLNQFAVKGFDDARAKSSEPKEEVSMRGFDGNYYHPILLNASSAL